MKALLAWEEQALLAAGWSVPQLAIMYGMAQRLIEAGSSVTVNQLRRDYCLKPHQDERGDAALAAPNVDREGDDKLPKSDASPVAGK